MEGEKDLSKKGLDSLQAIAKAVSHGLDLDTILERTADKILEFMDIENLAFFFYEEQSDSLSLKIHRGLNDDFLIKISRIKMGEGLTGYAAQQKRIIITDSAKDDPRSLPVIREELKNQSSCYIPLLSKDKLYGVLSMGYHSFHPFTLQEIQVLETIGNLIGQAIENTRLFEDLVKYSSELEKMVEAKTQEILKKNGDLEQAYEDLKLAQERLIKASRLAAIGEVSLTVRHEVNNPLTTILGETQLLLMGQNLPEEAKSSLKTIEKMCLRIQNVVKKLSEVKEDKTKEFMKGLRTIDFD